jgi:hypothetical protein
MNHVASTVALTLCAVVISGFAGAQQRERGGPTPSSQGAAVHFVGLNDGANLPTKATIRLACATLVLHLLASSGPTRVITTC